MQDEAVGLAGELAAINRNYDLARNIHHTIRKAATALTTQAARIAAQEQISDDVHKALAEADARIAALEGERDAAFNAGLERAAGIAAQTILDARTGEIDNDLRCIGHILDTAIRAAKEPSNG